MPITTRRRVGVVGKSRTFYVTLPKDWCEGSELSAGTSVTLLANGVLVVIPPGADLPAGKVLRLMREGEL